ncbi:hypothetical protein G5714_012904 [Onychostoma macrolepis]|uniref:Carbonic anhydrase n=1 Tax=Onychostoma macrolepis TaxID=369639 RepID=A0A7J6CIG3_9TELE|nr:hypothetical protein G5714_012904 [Onychostoma macrolepis]
MKPTHHITAYRRANQVREMIVLLVTCLAALLCPTVHSADASVEWCYHKPACNFTTWSKIAPQYCNGSKQSPINIVTASVQGNPNLTSFNLTGFDDNSTFMSIGNSGDSVVVNLDDEKIKVQGGALPGVYNTKQFHLHWGNGSSSPGSEHTVDGKQYPMELHIVSVHSKYNGSVSAALAAKDSTALAVLGFFIEGTNEANKTKSWDILTSYLTKIRNSGDQTSDIMNQITLNSLIEGVDRTKYYRYQGSLTTPSCNEAVIWTVFKEPVKVSQAFINRFSTTVFFKDASASVLNTNNFRGVQPLNGRVVTSQMNAWFMTCFAAFLLPVSYGAPISVAWCDHMPSCSDCCLAHNCRKRLLKTLAGQRHIVNEVVHNGSTILAALGFFIEATYDTGKPESWKTLTSPMQVIKHASLNISLWMICFLDWTGLNIPLILAL